jgi:hypothetical protein
VTQLSEKLDRTAADIRDEMRRGFTETQAMIKFSQTMPVPAITLAEVIDL